MNYDQLHQILKAQADPARAEHSARYFKTGRGEYAEGDLFLGITVPELRTLTGQYVKHWSSEYKLSGIKPDATDSPCLSAIKSLLTSQYHEERLLALLILVKLFAKKSEDLKQLIYHFYLAHTRWVNNWDLVDSSAYHIAGPYLANKDRSVLYRLAQSESLWERRIAVMATFHFIRQGDFSDTLQLCEQLLTDPEDLIHKATGWMLREIGKRDVVQEKAFLDRHSPQMPRTMLRYAIEKFPKEERQYYLTLG